MADSKKRGTESTRHEPNSPEAFPKYKVAAVQAAPVFLDREAMQQALQTYYRVSGWDPEQAAPTPEKLHELDLGWVVEELAKPETCT